MKSAFPLAVLAALLAAPALANDDTDDETAALCAEAEERYVALFGAPSAEAEGVTVVLTYEYNFCPRELTVPIGTTVRWVNVDKRTSHSVLSPAMGIPETDRFFPEESVELTFLTEDAGEYLCGPHWETQNMIGMITVQP
ncbi:copper-binding protein [Thalassococcus sp. CAU 1522]|uniref:Copper-binding protein n=1 Tax=Thalassococcus arenae TaxID=2851652 RepID=A0ABS6ND80_9RHOB|nr:plastocyanin/azurin family copper-binding protein [Thalassococcus arenae]MBV2361652.1 copper-binding protein [Thalassococcus arenae]